MKPIGTPLKEGEGMAEVLDRQAVFTFGYHWIADEEEAAEQIEFARRLLYLPVGSLVLMPFCGAGWHAHELAMWGYQVVGTDPCQKLVEEALERNHKMGVSAISIALALPKGNRGAMRNNKVMPIGREGATLNIIPKAGQLGDNLPIAEPSHHHLGWWSRWKCGAPTTYKRNAPIATASHPNRLGLVQRAPPLKGQGQRQREGINKDFVERRQRR
jgi:hypothetical protein